MPDENYSTSQADLPFILKKEHEVPALDFLPFDIDDNGDDEFLYLIKHDDQKLKYSLRCYREMLGIPLFQINFSKGRIDESPSIYRDEKGELSILVSVIEDNIAYLQQYNEHGDSLDRFEITRGIDRNGNGFWDGHISPMAVSDLNADGSPDLLIQIATSYDRHPRGVCAFDIKNGKKLWEFPTGTSIKMILCADLDRDKIPEVISSSSAPSNGSAINDTDDDHSYLIVLNNNGNLIKLKEMGATFSGCYIQIADVDGDDVSELITLLDSEDKIKGAPGRLTIWNGTADTKRKEITGDFNNSFIKAADINRDGKAELVIAGGLQSRIVVYNEDLEIITQKPIDFKPDYLLIDELNLDGSLEIILSRRDQTMIFNNKLEVIAHSEYGGRPRLVKDASNLPKKLALVWDSNLVLLTMHKNIGYYRIRIAWLFGGLAIGALLTVLIAFGVFRLATRKHFFQTMIYIVEKLPLAIILFDQKGRLLFSNKPAAEYLDLKDDSPKSPQYCHAFMNDLQKEIDALFDKITPGEVATHALTLPDGRNLQINVHDFTNSRMIFRGNLVIVQDTTFHSESKRALEWAAMSQKLAHEIKNPLYTILLTLQRLQLAYQEDQVENISTYDKYTHSALEEVERLQRVADGFMKFTKLRQPELKVISVDAVVKQIEEHTRDWLPNKINLKIEIERNLPDVKVDMELMQRLFFNLFDNAVRAMDGRGRIYLRVNLMQLIEAEQNSKTTEMVSFDISDTGCGIAEDHIQQLFQPYFSLREGGTGLGLMICKKIVEDHQGRISIQSKVGVGTTVKVELPVVINK